MSIIIILDDNNTYILVGNMKYTKCEDFKYANIQAIRGVN